MTTIGYVVLALVVLLLMITIHEFGHYIFGKKLGFKINEFSIGFGKAIFSKKLKSGETFSIRLIPLGGYCAFAGEDQDDTDPIAPNVFTISYRIVGFYDNVGTTIFDNFEWSQYYQCELRVLAGTPAQNKNTVTNPGALSENIQINFNVIKKSGRQPELQSPTIYSSVDNQITRYNLVGIGSVRGES